jgi:hypothetical protein
VGLGKEACELIQNEELAIDSTNKQNFDVIYPFLDHLWQG